MADSILAHNSRTIISPDMEWWWNINDSTSFHFRLFSQNFENTKNLFGVFGPFFPKIGQKTIYLEKRTLPVFKYPSHIPQCKKIRKKLMSHSWDKSWTDGRTERQTDRQAGRQAGRQTGRKTDRQAERQTDNGDLIGPSVGRVSKDLVISFLNVCDKTCKM